MSKTYLLDDEIQVLLHFAKMGYKKTTQERIDDVRVQDEASKRFLSTLDETHARKNKTGETIKKIDKKKAG